MIYWHETHTVFNLCLSACLKNCFLLQVTLKFNGIFQKESLLYSRLGRGLGHLVEQSKGFHGFHSC